MLLALGCPQGQTLDFKAIGDEHYLCRLCTLDILGSGNAGSLAMPPGGSVRALTAEARLTADELRSLELGGNARFRAFLEGEAVGISAAVWRASPA